MRTVVRIQSNPLRTRRGNPRDFLYTLACGHEQRSARLVSAKINLFLLREGLAARMKCYECSVERKEGA